MKKTIKIIMVLLLTIGLTACKKKNVYKDTYTLQYFYVEGCPNCQYFSEEGLPLIEEEFGEHMKIEKYNMDDPKTLAEVKVAYDAVVNNLTNFDRAYYGVGPFLVLEGYYVQLGVSDVDKYLDNLIEAINGKKLSKEEEPEMYYYLKDGKIKEER